MGFVSNKEEEANKCLKEMDLDGDGRVSFAEFMVKWKVTWSCINDNFIKWTPKFICDLTHSTIKVI